MQEAEEKLTIDQTRYFFVWLCRITHGIFSTTDWMKQALVVHATASQRAEALLRTIGKWVEK
jgi:hypothetical protein